MKTTTKLFLAFLTLATLYSCTTDDVEGTSFQKEVTIEEHSDFLQSMMQRDSISKEGEESDPPTKPIIVIVKP